MPEEWKESIIVPICEKGGKTDCSNYRGISRVRNSMQHVKVNSMCRGKLLGVISVEVDATGQILFIYSAFVKYLRKKLT